MSSGGPGSFTVSKHKRVIIETVQQFGIAVQGRTDVVTGGEMTCVASPPVVASLL